MPPYSSELAIAQDPGVLLPLSLTDDLSEGIVVMDRDSEIRYVNPAMIKIFGYARSELVGQSLTVLMPESHRDRHLSSVERYLRTGERNLSWADVELPGRHRDGSELDLRISFTEFSYRGERSFAGVIRDLTEAGDPEEARRTQARRYRVLFEENVAAVFRMAPDGRILSANAALAELIGEEDPEALRTRKVTDLYAGGRDRQGLLEDLRGHREVRNRELELRRRDGTNRWCLVNGVWIEDPASPESEALVGTVVDISARKRIERELELSEQRYRRLFEQDLVGVYRSRPDEDGGVVECNQAFAAMFGFESPAAVAEAPAGAFYATEEARREMLAELRERGSLVKQEIELRRRDGSPIWVLAHARLVEDPGRGELIEGLFFEISEQVRAREALRRTKEMFQGVFDISPVALKIVDPAMDSYLEVNQAFEELFGYARNELFEGAAGSEKLWAEPGKRERIYRRVRRGETVRNEEARLRHKDGTDLDVLFSAGALTLDGRQYLVAAVQDISHLKEVERELEHRALHDPLTGLPNRALFSDRLEHALARSRRTGGLLAVLFLDFDGFKRINDAFGHGAGDEALRELSARLGRSLRAQDTAARLGGDEFGVILESLEGPERAEKVAGRILESLQQPLKVDGEDARIDASCGIAFWRGGDDAGDTPMPQPEVLLRQADLAMYVAKDHHGSRWRIYDPETQKAEPRRLQDEMQLRRGIEADEFVPHYQPIISLEDGRLVGCETLARWERPGDGLVSPGKFIPLAEETGLIVELGYRLGRRALHDFARWRELGITPPGFHLNVNLSARQLQDPELVEGMAALLREVSFDPSELVFEVTESAAMGRGDAMSGLQELGVKISVDDFGTEYATLDRLTTLDVDSLKIDRSFVDRLMDSRRHGAIVEATLALADALGIDAIAEGIETEEQLARLQELGCRYGQGYLFARPVTAEEITGWLEEDRSWMSLTRRAGG